MFKVQSPSIERVYMYIGVYIGIPQTNEGSTMMRIKYKAKGSNRQDKDGELKLKLSSTYSRGAFRGKTIFTRPRKGIFGSQSQQQLADTLGWICCFKNIAITVAARDAS